MTPPKSRLQSQPDPTTKREDEAVSEEFDQEEDSMAHDIPIRKLIRSKRDTEERLEKIETKQDEIVERVARMEGKLDTALSVIVPEAQSTKRHQIDSRTKIIIAIVGAISATIGAVITAVL